MASGTRSGRNREENHLSTVEKKDGKSTILSCSEMKGSCSRGKVGNRKGDKCSTSSGCISTDSQKLRGPLQNEKKMGKFNAGTRRSERLDKPCQSSPSSSGRLGPLEQKSITPLRRSERIEKIGISSSASCKKSGNSASSDLNVRNTENKSRKACTMNSIKDNDDSSASGLPKRRRFIDVRSYRKFIPLSLAEGSGSKTSKKLQECIEKKDTSSAEMHEMEDFKDSVECSNFGFTMFCENGNFDTVVNEKNIKKKTCDLPDAKPISQCEEDSYLLLSPSDKIFEVVVGYEIKEDRSKSSKAEKSIPKDCDLVANSDLDGDLVDITVRLEAGSDLNSVLPVKLSETNGCSQNVSNSEDVSSMTSDLRNKNAEYCITCSKSLRCRKDFEPHVTCMCTGIPNLKMSCEHVQMGEGATDNVKESSTGKDGCSYICVVCKQSGQLLCCEGRDCKKSFHLSCLDPPLEDVPPGSWLCHPCTRVKMELGVYAISLGIESVLDVKDGLRNCKDYLVKYKGLAHVHNQWVPESQLLMDAPLILSKFQLELQKDKVVSWKRLWTEPHRLLLKRILPPLNLSEENSLKNMSDYGNCSYEWLVKWKCLGYEHATWEFENSLALSTHEAIALMEDYRRRHENAKKIDPSYANETRKNTFHKLLHFPEGFPTDLGDDHLNTVNALGEFWQKSQSVVLIDEKERITKLILFLLALRSQVYKPFLIITSLASLLLWEDEFIRLAPSINTVVYDGNQDARKIIRTLEFSSDDGGVMFEVLLTHSDAVIEDFEALNCFVWEAIVFDDYMGSNLSRHLELVLGFNCSFRLLFLNGLLKDNIIKHLIDGGTFVILKEQLARHLAHERKSDTSRFLEYWVPVQLSEVQLEQYCATLVSNSMVLNSCLKVDHVGALHDILVSTRKCCDHPYLVDPKLQASLIKGLEVGEYLNIGVKASGKLRLLDRILHEMKIRSLRVLVLFQSVAGSISIGDILDDFLRQRFGVDSYERIDKGLMMSKKLASVQKFNSKENGRFVFLIEDRACLPSIKLSSLDCVIIYDGDWNPLNDLKALQRINIDSCENVKVFRLFSSHTVEEKLLSYAKCGAFLDSKIRNVSANLTHSLISWGAAYLFGKLDELHRSDDKESQTDIVNSDGCLNAVVSEFLALLSNEIEDGKFGQCPILVKAPQNGTSYCLDAMLSGEEGISTSDIDPPTFWSNLLKERSPNWKYISGSFQRSRRRVQNFDEFSKEEKYEARKKRRKVGNMDAHANPPHVSFSDGRIAAQSQKDNGVLPITSSSHCLHPAHASLIEISPNDNYTSNGDMSSVEVSSGQGELGKQPSDVNSDSLEKIRSLQKSLHLLLRPDLSKLCNILSLTEEVKHLSEKFLEYTMNKLMVNAESEPLLQALKISLCWRAASLLRQNVDFSESLALAQKYLNYECSKEQALSIYGKLCVLKKEFSRGMDASTSRVDSNPLVKQSFSQIKETSISVVPDNENLEKDKSGFPGKEFPRRQIGLVEDTFLKRQQNLQIKQRLELEELLRQSEAERVKLKEIHVLELDLVRTLENDSATRNIKIDLVNEEFSKIMAEFDTHMKLQHKELVNKQTEAKHLEQKIKEVWLEDAKAGRLNESFENFLLSESGVQFKEFVAGRSKDPESTKTSKLEDSRILADARDKDPSGEGLIDIAASHESSGIPNEPEKLVSIIDGISAEATGMLIGDKCDMMTEKGLPCSQSYIIPEIPTDTTVETVVLEEDIPSTHMTDSNGRGLISPPPDCAEHSSLAGTERNESRQLPAMENQVLCENESHLQASAPQQIKDSTRPSDDVGSSLVDLELSNRIRLGNNQYPEHLCVEDSMAQGLNSSTSGDPERLCDQIRFDNDQNPRTLSVEVSISQELNSPIAGDQEQICDLPLGNVLQESSPLETRMSTEQDPGSHLMHIFPLPSLQIPYALDPFQNELMRLRLQEDSLSKRHEEKICHLKLERDLELDKVRLKYALLANEFGKEYQNSKAILKKITDLVFLNKELAEHFKGIFIESRAITPAFSHGGLQRGTSQYGGLLPRAPQRSLQAAMPPPPPVPSPPTLASSFPPTPPRPGVGSTPILLPSFFLPPPRFAPLPPSFAPSSSSNQPTRPPSSFPSSSLRSLFAPISIPPHVYIGAETRAPAPHLQQFRPPGSAIYPRAYIAPLVPIVGGSEPPASVAFPIPARLTDTGENVAIGSTSVAKTGVLCGSDDE